MIIKIKGDYITSYVSVVASFEKDRRYVGEFDMDHSPFKIRIVVPIDESKHIELQSMRKNRFSQFFF